MRGACCFSMPTVRRRLSLVKQPKLPTGPTASDGAYQAISPTAPASTSVVSMMLRHTLMSASRTLSASRVVRVTSSPTPWRAW